MKKELVGVLGAAVLEAGEQVTHLGGTEPAMPAEGAQGGQLPRARPTGDGLGADPEQCSHFGGREQCVVG